MPLLMRALMLGMGRTTSSPTLFTSQGPTSYYHHAGDAAGAQCSPERPEGCRALLTFWVT